MEFLLYVFGCIVIVAFMILSMIIHNRGSWLFNLMGLMFGFMFIASMILENPFTITDTLSGFTISGSEVLASDLIMPFEFLPGLLTIGCFFLMIMELK